MKVIMKIFKSLGDLGLLIQRINEAMKNERKEQEGGFLSMLLETLAVCILGNALAGWRAIRAGENTIRAGENF